MILELAIGALHAWREGGGGGFEVWLLNGCGPNLCFPKAFEQSARFPWQKSKQSHLTFMAEIRHCLP